MTTLIKGGTTINPASMTTTKADIKIDKGHITAVAPNLPAAGAELIDATNMLVLPGFVDTHRHTWQAGIRATGADITFAKYLSRVIGELAPRYTPDDVYTGTLAGALDCLEAGITTVVDWSHIQHTPDHTAAAVEALKHSGIRAVFGYCSKTPEEKVLTQHMGHNLVTMAIAPMGPEIVDEATALNEWRLAQDLNLPVTVHMGGHGRESAERGLTFLEQNNLLKPNTNYVHGTHYTDEALKRIANSGGTISVSPLVEVELGLGTQITARARAAGAPTGLGADTVVSGPSDMFSLMRAAYTLERARENTTFTTRDALKIATTEGAQAASLGNTVGTLNPGTQADLILLRTDLLGVAPATDPIGTIVLCADTASVDTVLVAGQIIKQKGKLLHHDVTKILSALTESAAKITAT